MGALVLGGGGIVGLAWEIGVLGGLAEAAGYDPAAADVIVGTSAGSAIGAQLRLGRTVAELEESQRRPGPAIRERVEPDFNLLLEAFGSWIGEPGMTPERARRVGEIALRAPTPSEDALLEWFGAMLGADAWPPGDLRITGVSCATGRRIVWDAGSGVPLLRAVAASCSVPTIFPPITVGEDRFVDGGVWSGSNADVVADDSVDWALFIGLGGEWSPFISWCGASLEPEAETLRARGIRLETITPGQQFAPVAVNLMDPSGREAALEAGKADGRRAAERLRALTG